MAAMLRDGKRTAHTVVVGVAEEKARVKRAIELRRLRAICGLEGGVLAEYTLAASSIVLSRRWKSFIPDAGYNERDKTTMHGGW